MTGQRWQVKEREGLRVNIDKAEFHFFEPKSCDLDYVTCDDWLDLAFLCSSLHPGCHVAQ